MPLSSGSPGGIPHLFRALQRAKSCSGAPPGLASAILCLGEGRDRLTRPMLAPPPPRSDTSLAPSCINRRARSFPVRAKQNSASPARPLSPFLPGTGCSMRRHCASVSSRRIKIALPVAILNRIRDPGGIPYVSTGPRLASVANCKIVRQNRHFQRSSAANFACRREARCLSFEDDSPPRRTACRCRPLLDGQRSGWPSAGGSRLAELSRGAGDGAADELCGSRTAAAGRAA
jgi:hypothetical protein